MLVADAGASAVFEAAIAAEPSVAPKSVANWVTGEYLRLAKLAGPDAEAGPALRVDGAELGHLVGWSREAGSRRRTPSKSSSATPRRGARRLTIVDDLGLRQIDDRDGAGRRHRRASSPLNPAAVADIRAGKGQATGFIVGQVMKATRGQAQPSTVQAIVRERLGLD